MNFIQQLNIYLSKTVNFISIISFLINLKREYRAMLKKHKKVNIAPNLCRKNVKIST